MHPIFPIMLFLVGRYVYIEASSPRRNGDFARLSSPLISVSSSSTKCLKFWYHMYGPHVDTLNVYTNTSTLGSPIWSRNRTQGNQWKSATVEIQMSQSYLVSSYYDVTMSRQILETLRLVFMANGKCQIPIYVS